MTSPNMGLIIPSPGVTPGPTWASELNTALETIDSHDHTTGNGVQVPAAGLNINDDLNINDYALTNVGSVDLTAQSSTLSSGSARIFSYGGELYYRDASSNNVRITLSGAVDAGATGAITGLSSPASASFSSITDTFSWQEDTNQFAKMSSADLVVHEYGAVSPNSVTIKSAASLGSSYTLTLPAAVPAATYPLTMSTAGQLENTGTISLAAGSASAPTLRFSTDTTTGMYSVGANQIGLAASGANVLTVSSSGVTAAQPFKASAGTQVNPSITFSGDPNTGLYSSVADTIFFTTGGAARLSLTTTNLLLDTSMTDGISSVLGSASTPSYNFRGDTDTGIYRSAANQLSVSCAGISRMDVSTSGVYIGGALTVTNGADVTGALTATSLNLSSGGAFKVTTFTGSLTASATTTLTVSGAIYGMCGYSQRNASSSWTPMLSDEGATSSTTNSIRYGLAASNTEVALQNFDSNSTNNYRVIVFHA